MFKQWKAKLLKEFSVGEFTLTVKEKKEQKIVIISSNTNYLKHKITLKGEQITILTSTPNGLADVTISLDALARTFTELGCDEAFRNKFK